MRLPTTCCLLLLLLAGAVAAQSPMSPMPPMGSVPPGSGYGPPPMSPMPPMPPVYGQPNPNFPPPDNLPGPRPGFCPDPNQLTPCNTTYQEHNWALSYDPSVDCVPVPYTTSYVAVDFLYLRTHFSQENLAFGQAGPTGTGNVNFEQPGYQFAPRLTIRIQPWDEFGVSGSWFRFQSFERTLSFTNSNPNEFYTSAPFPNVPGTAMATITGSGGALPSQVSVPLSNVVQSPSTYFFIPLLPTTSIFNETGGNPAGTPIVPFFEFSSGVGGGFPDKLVFRSSFDFQTADLKIDRTWELGDLRGTISFGAQYLYFSHSYLASRISSSNGSPVLTGYDPFDADGPLETGASVFFGLNDYDVYRYSYRYAGVGPKISADVTWPPTGPLQFYARVGGAVALGGRHESTSVTSKQSATFADQDTQQELTDFQGGVLTFDRTVNVNVSHNTFSAVPIAEAEAGFSYRFTNWAFKPFLGASIIAQYYGGGGSDLNPNATIFLYGVSATAGIEF